MLETPVAQRVLQKTHMPKAAGPCHLRCAGVGPTDDTRGFNVLYSTLKVYKVL